MKELTIYQCEVCGNKYSNKIECGMCESKHINPVEIVGYCPERALFDFYPSYVEIKFDNGEIRKYYFDRMIR